MCEKLVQDIYEVTEKLMTLEKEAQVYASLGASKVITTGASKKTDEDPRKRKGQQTLYRAVC